MCILIVDLPFGDVRADTDDVHGHGQIQPERGEEVLCGVVNCVTPHVEDVNVESPAVISGTL